MSKAKPNKTKAEPASVDAFVAALADPVKQADSRTLIALMERLSGEPATMWGTSIIGFGRYHYRYESGREGDWSRIGFSPRSANLVLYLMDGFEGQADLLAKLGKHKAGGSCLYVKKLADVDLAVVEQLVTRSLAHMDETYPR